ncbi:MAG TPA: septum formation inhibitor Maf [Intrasporangiaceae bacterium]|nr:septum formation inhibitor Maf [Intrasporangiaceae bacterium]
MDRSGRGCLIVALVPAPIRLVLASASPARRALLRQAGIEPTICVSTVDEAALEANAPADLCPGEVALLLARAKAEDAAEQLDGDHIVLGCDSVLELAGKVYGKPRDAAEAVQRWQRMRSRSGVLHTGHWIIDDRSDGSAGTLGASAETIVHFADLSDAEIEDYVATGEPLRVAGAFTIDGLGAPYISRIEGDHTNVVGLSLPLLRELLLEIGVSWRDLTTSG